MFLKHYTHLGEFCQKNLKNFLIRKDMLLDAYFNNATLK